MMRRTTAFAVALIAIALTTRCYAEENFLQAWENRVRSTVSKQPSWVVPVLTPSSGLVQLARFDAYRQITPTHNITWNIDGGKGFNLIPWYNTELDVNMPALIEHNNPKVADGVGDVSVLLKYRILEAPDEEGSYSVSAGIAATAPSGSYKNGSPGGSVSPTVYFGKGYRKLDVQTAASIMLPTSFTSSMGRPVTWNSAVQYRVGKRFWPEVEANSTFFRGGANDGKNQVFLTPGLMFSRFKLMKAPANRLGVILGAGEQIAVTRFHSYNHALVLTTRISF
jgi:hypothetical protein